MDRLFCVLALCALLALSAGACAGGAAQPAFFSLLFPQLMPGGESIATPGEAQWMEVFL